jgi:hypothetical protein
MPTTARAISSQAPRYASFHVTEPSISITPLEKVKNRRAAARKSKSAPQPNQKLAYSSIHTIVAAVKPTSLPISTSNAHSSLFAPSRYSHDTPHQFPFSHSPSHLPALYVQMKRVVKSPQSAWRKHWPANYKQSHSKKPAFRIGKGDVGNEPIRAHP